MGLRLPGKLKRTLYNPRAASHVALFARYVAPAVVDGPSGPLDHQVLKNVCRLTQRPSSAWIVANEL